MISPRRKVYLVGAGPGDPELITLKAKRLLSQADVILYDHLAAHDLLDLAPPAAERIYVGKKRANHSVSQDEICALLVELGRRGVNVVRLKGGDPYLFGRGGEEAEALQLAGIPFEVVPGVTSPLGIAAYTGVPLTHRDHTSVVTFVTGHDVDRIDWTKVGAAETLVVFMGLSHLTQIAARIIEEGRDPNTPAMAVRWGTRPDQEVLVGTLATLPALVREQGMKPPATIVIGEVVQLRQRLSWFEKLPLFGQKIIVTRARQQASTLSVQLTELGASVIELPVIEIQAGNTEALDAALLRLETYDFLIFTSVNGVERFLERLDQSPRDLRSIRGLICAIGPATRDALERFHLKVDITAKEYVAEGLLEALAAHDMEGKRILIARAAVARDVLPDTLRQRGAEVEVVEAYRTVPPEGLAERAREVLAQNPDWVTFTSSSTVRNLAEAVGPQALHHIRTASIGPVTTETLAHYGIPLTIQATEYTVQGLVNAILSTTTGPLQ